MKMIVKKKLSTIKDKKLKTIKKLEEIAKKTTK